MKHSFLLLAAGLFLFSSCKQKSPQLVTLPEPPPPPKINATATGTSGPGPQTIKGGDVTMTLAADSKPLSFTQGNGPNLLREKDPGQGFYLTTGTAPDDKNIPITNIESKDGKLILTAADNTRVTLAVNAGNRHISFNLENIENVPQGTEPVLNFVLNFKSKYFPEMVAFDYMIRLRGRYDTARSLATASWPYFWKRTKNDPAGGFAFFIPQNEEEHNEALFRIWTEENVPHPKVEGEWTYERAKQWAADWNKNAQDTTHLMISAEKPEDLDPLIEYAKKMKVSRVYMHTDTWRGQYWVQDRDSLSANTKVFPRGEADLKAFIDKLKANGMGTMMHTLCYGIGPEGSKYMGKGKKTDRRLANWGKGKLEQPVSATDKTILFRPDPGVKFPDPDTSLPWPKSLPSYQARTEILIGDEIVKCTFTDTDKPVWKLINCVRGPEPAKHQAGTEILGLLKPYGQNYYPSSMSDLIEITAKDYAEFFNRLGVQHHEYDGAECHNDVPWGFSKWSMFVYQNTKLPMTSNTSSASANPWDLMYRLKKNGEEKARNKGSNHGGPSGIAVLALQRDSRLATSPIENHFTMALGATVNTPGYVFGKPEPMFGLFPNVIRDHGLAPLIAEQFTVWREIAPKLTPKLRKQISETYKEIPGSSHRSAKIVYEARRAGSGYELQPFTIMTRGKQDADWTTVQEFSNVLPRQYVVPGMRVKLDNPFGPQVPQFIIRVMSGYTDTAVDIPHAAPTEVLSKDMQDYLAASGVQTSSTAAASAATPGASNADPYRLQPKAAQISNHGRHQFKDVDSALQVSLDNLNKPEIFQQVVFPVAAFKGNSQNSPGLALTVTGDGSGALLVIQVGSRKDYVVPIDFTGRKDIFIPTSETSRTVGGWGMRYTTKGATYGIFHGVSIGFGRVPANAHPKILIENLRMVGEKASSVKNPVIHAGTGTLAIQGEVKSNQYLWYQGGDSVGVYDKNWNLQATLPVVARNYTIKKGFSEFWIEGECSAPSPWFDVQFITKGETIKLADASPPPSSQVQPAPSKKP